MEECCEMRLAPSPSAEHWRRASSEVQRQGERCLATGYTRGREAVLSRRAARRNRMKVPPCAACLIPASIKQQNANTFKLKNLHKKII